VTPLAASQPRGHIPADLVEAAPAGADCVDGAEGDNAAQGCEDNVTPGLEPLNADLNPRAPIKTLQLHF